MLVRLSSLLVLVGAVALGGCGGKTGFGDAADAARPRGPEPRPETCNRLDDDLDGSVDEAFREPEGRYVHPQHCGTCDAPCLQPGEHEVAVECGLVEGTPACIATACASGYALSPGGRCVPAFERLCLPCVADGDCGASEGARCVELDGEGRCAAPCGAACPLGYDCVDELCLPGSGSCLCGPTDDFVLACRLEDPTGEACAGSARCQLGNLTACEPPEESCDERDNDCDGLLDEGFRDARGAYVLDVHHCGGCGIDCSLSTSPEGDIVCGGDPFAPRCTLFCPDEVDGRTPGDRVDGDGAIATGCECTFGAANDVPGPVGAAGEALDVNCDGADGIVVESFYVATDGDDAGPGSPTLPLRTLGEALRRAALSLGTPEPRPHVFVASGSYAESVELSDGVKLHGGYRRDFRALDPRGFRVDLRAPVDTDTVGGAALVARGAGLTDTVVEWMAIRGADSPMASSPSVGVALIDVGPLLVLRENELRSGVAGGGSDGIDGAAGATPPTSARPGALPRAAREDVLHACINGPANVVAGGSGGENRCGGASVAGGGGGAPRCPVFGRLQPAGARGASGPDAAGGAGGAGGMDSEGPLFGGSCAEPVCCGLADFVVPGDFTGPRPGARGGDGGDGVAGLGCTDAFGAFLGEVWLPGGATGGTAGTAGAGGGGGGGGGGAAMSWVDGVCEYADGLGGGGGGGGAGGCGGQAGRAGRSGGPAVAVLLRFTSSPAGLPLFEGNVLAPSDGGPGGDGGAGGGGGLGGEGAFGGEVPRELRSTPTLAGPFPGARGGPGGKGGSGGGGGGGCGGGSIGIWVTGLGTTEPPEAVSWRTLNTFELGRPGEPGAGGGGGAPASDGVAGGAVDVLAR